MVCAAIVILTPARALAEFPGAAHLEWTVAGAPPIVIDSAWIEQPDGTFKTSGEANGQSAASLLTWTLTADLRSQGNASLSGIAHMTNLSTSILSFQLQIMTGICPALANPSLIGANVTVGLTANQGGGWASCPAGDAVWTILGGHTDQQLFFGPFVMTAGGVGSIAVSDHFGTPMPSLPVGPIGSSVGVRYSAVVSSGDRVTVSTLLIVGDDPTSLPNFPAPNCPADFDGDGMVTTADLGELLSGWGPSGPCDMTDLDDDGVVGASDLAIVLTAWGRCD